LHFDNTELANATLMAEHPAAQSINSTGLQDAQYLLGDRMAIIRKYQKKNEWTRL
jgi:hypothetical protein